MLLNCGVGEVSWEPLGLKGDPTSPSYRKSVLNIHWKDWCWNWNSNTLATWCEELTHWKRPWCRERLRAGAEGDGRGWDGGMATPTRWTWVWVNSRSWWWTGKPGVLQSIGSQRVRHDWATELNWGLYKNSSLPEEFYCLYCCCYVWSEWERKSKNLGIHLDRGRWMWMLSSGLKTWRCIISSWQEARILRNRVCYCSKTEIDLICFLRNRVSWDTDHCV